MFYIFHLKKYNFLSLTLLMFMFTRQLSLFSLMRIHPVFPTISEKGIYLLAITRDNSVLLMAGLGQSGIQKSLANHSFIIPLRTFSFQIGPAFYFLSLAHGPSPFFLRMEYIQDIVSSGKKSLYYCNMNALFLLKYPLLSHQG